VENGIPFLIMDYAPNGTLRQRHPKGAVLPPAVFIPYVKQVSSALQYAHDRKFIHRDVKPENMLLGSRGEVLLSDFGLVLIAQSTGSRSIQEMSGTIAYMAPEQLQGKPHPASDQYSLGIIVYEWLTGDRPFNGAFVEIASQHMLTPPAPLHEKRPGIAPAIEEVVLTALAKSPQQRFASIQAFATALEQAALSTQPAFSVPPYAAPAGQPPLPSPLVTRSDQSSRPTPVNTPQLSQSAIPTYRTAADESAPTIPMEPGPLSQTSIPTYITPPGQSPWPAPLSAPESNRPSFAAFEAPPAVSPPSISSDRSLDKLRPERGISRRTVVLGLAGLAAAGVAGGGLIWLARSQGLHIPFPTPKVTPPVHVPSPTPKVTPSVVSVESINSTGAMFGFDLQHTSFNPDEHILSPSNVSHLALDWTAATGNSTGSSPVVANGVVYVVSHVTSTSYDNWKLYALNAATGNVLWQQSGNGRFVNPTPAVANGVVYVDSGNGLAAFDAVTGHIRWVTPSTVIVDSSPAVAHGIVYVAGGNQVYAFDATTGHPRWSSDLIGNYIQSPSPAVANGVVYVGSAGNGPGTGRVYALDATTGHARWSSDLIGVNASPTVVNDLVYIVLENGGLAAFDAATGHTRWVTPATAGSTGSSPAVAHGIVYVAQGQVYAFDATTGHSRWSSDFNGAYAGGSPLVANGVVYVGSAKDNKVYALDATTGSTLWTSPPTGGQIFSTPVVANGVVYVSSDVVYAFHLP